uniref:Uncharacterized protein n=1 Tax=Meloidogyne enterolobii TaxID=390850 RepID=A0A6V7WN01_MELEN|nr:unnamed protein product [Meloidogyne enterolobii]
MDDKTYYSPIYSTYNEKGFMIKLFLNALLISLFSLIAIIMNSSVCYITIKYRYGINKNCCTRTYLYKLMGIRD